MTDSKPQLIRDNTMKVTAKEGDKLLGANKPDPDAKTRRDAKKIDDIMAEPPAKKKKGTKTGLKRETTIAKTIGEAKLLGISDADLVDTGVRRTRARARGDVPKPSLKKAGTMVKTAKEGKAFLKRGKAKKAAAPVADNEDKKEDDEAGED